MISETVKKFGYWQDNATFDFGSNLEFPRFFDLGTETKKGKSYEIIS